MPAGSNQAPDGRSHPHQADPGRACWADRPMPHHPIFVTRTVKVLAGLPVRSGPAPCWTDAPPDRAFVVGDCHSSTPQYWVARTRSIGWKVRLWRRILLTCIALTSGAEIQRSRSLSVVRATMAAYRSSTGTMFLPSPRLGCWR